MNHELIRRTKSVESYEQLMQSIHDHLNRVNSPLKRINAEAHNSIVELAIARLSKRDNMNDLFKLKQTVDSTQGHSQLLLQVTWRFS